MRSRIMVTGMFLTVVLAFSCIAAAQAPPSVPPPEGWGNCPRCQNNNDRAKAWRDYKVDGHPFNPKDLSGVWGYDGVANAFDPRNMPALTEWGKQQHEATFGDKAPDGSPLHSKDTSGRSPGSLSIAILTDGLAPTRTITDLNSSCCPTECFSFSS